MWNEWDLVLGARWVSQKAVLWAKGETHYANWTWCLSVTIETKLILFQQGSEEGSFNSGKGGSATQTLLEHPRNSAPNRDGMPLQQEHHSGQGGPGTRRTPCGRKARSGGLP